MSQSGPVTLTTTRLILREHSIEDLPSAMEAAADPMVTRYLTWDVQTEASEREAIERFIRNGMIEPRVDYELAIEHDGAYAGVVHLAIRDRTHKRGEIGFVLRQSLWGQGIMPEAASALVRFGFDQLDLRRIEATCHPDNLASARVLEKIGMSYGSRLRSHMYVKGEWRDSLLYSIISDR